MDVALTTPVAEGARRLRGVGTGGLVPGGAGGLRAISFAKPNKGLPLNREKNRIFSNSGYWSQPGMFGAQTLPLAE